MKGAAIATVVVVSAVVITLAVVLAALLAAPPRLSVLQIEDRSAPMTDRFIAHNASEAARQRFRHVVHRRGIDGLPPWWWKVFGLRKLMDEHPEADLVMWVDSDAYLSPNALQNIRKMAREKENVMWLSPDAPAWDSAFCAGAFVVRNDARGRSLMDRWVGLFDRARWTRDEATGKWEAKGAWAGPDYEQGSFTQHLMPDASSLGIAQQDWRTFSEVNCEAPDERCVAVHLAGPYKDHHGARCMALLEEADKADKADRADRADG